jgi:hypothetical protein
MKLTSLQIAAIMLFIVSLWCVLKANFMYWRMLTEVNGKLPVENRFREYCHEPMIYMRILTAYRTLHPEETLTSRMYRFGLSGVALGFVSIILVFCT